MKALTGAELKRFHAGDAALFKCLVDGFSPRLLAVTRSFAVDSAEAHDLLQETWRRAYEKRRSYSGSGTLLGWLYTVCRSVCVTATREAARRGSALAGSWTPLGSVSVDPSEAAERSELKRAVDLALMSLPEREREVLILRVLDGLSTREVAGRLGIAEGTVKATLHHAMKKMESAMEEWAR